jgi:hypothetical protein
LTAGRAHADENEQVAQAEREFIQQHGDSRVRAVRIEGLKRTHPIVVEQWIHCSVGAPLSSCDLPRIREWLYRMGIFTTVDVLLTDQADGVEIVFRVDEKWTLYPIPILWYSAGTQLAGLLLVEANLFGYNKGVAIGGTYSNRGWYALAGYNDPNIAFTNLWGSLHAFLGSTLVENDAPDGSVEQSFDMSRFDFEYALGWTFWDRLSPLWNGALRVAQLGTVHVPGAEPPGDATVAVQGFKLIYADRRYLELYDEGLRLSAEVQHGFPLEAATRGYDDAIFDAKWAGPAPPRGFVDVRSHAFVGSMPAAFEERLGGVEGSRALPGVGLVAADRYASLSVVYQAPFLELPLGTATGGPFGEVGRYARNDERAVTYGGPGVELRFYLKRVAIPAVGVDAAYEVGSKQIRFSIAVGYRPAR